jgi:hypothetical protein
MSHTEHPTRPTARLQFRHFVRRIFLRKKNGEIDENAVYLIPLLAINPMAKDHLTALLDAYLAMDADGIGARVAAEAAARHADVPGDFKVGLIVADGLKGAGTNRYEYEFTFRFAPDRTLGQQADPLSLKYRRLATIRLLKSTVRADHRALTDSTVCGILVIGIVAFPSNTFP